MRSAVVRMQEPEGIGYGLQFVECQPKVIERGLVGIKDVLWPAPKQRLAAAQDVRAGWCDELEVCGRGGIARRVPEDLHSDIPPETSIRCPFTQRLSSDSSTAIIGPLSSGTPTRPNAVIFATCLLMSRLSR